MYNPFMWHIIRGRNKFIIRKLTMLGFDYWDERNAYIWHSLDMGHKYCGHDTLTDAQMVVAGLKVKKV